MREAGVRIFRDTEETDVKTSYQKLEKRNRVSTRAFRGSITIVLPCPANRDFRLLASRTARE